MSQGYRISTGRGGAGNMHFSNEKIVSPKIIPEGSQTPNILSPVYSTGRGGVGNMRKNIDPTITRLTQDVGDVSLHHYQNSNNNNKNKKKKLNRQNDNNKDCNNNDNNNNSIDRLDTNEDIITDLDVANEPFIASLENNTMEPSNSHHSQYLYQAVHSHTDDNNEDSDEDNSIVLDEDDYITPITNEDLFEENNMSKVTNVLSKIRSHISPIQSPNKSTINQQEKAKFVNTDSKNHSGSSGSSGGAGVDIISNNKQSNKNTNSNNSNSNKLRLVKTISRSREGTTKAISLKKTRRENSCGGNKSPPPIVIGRGGAGNIVSPINTNSKHDRSISLSNSNKKKPPSSSSKDNNNKNNNIPSRKKEKKGFLSSIMNMFA